MMTEASKVQTVWLAEHDGEALDETRTYPVTQPIDICWGSGAGNTAAMVMTLLYKDTDGQYKVAKMAYDPVPSEPTHNINYFNTNVDKTGPYCDSFLFKKEINASEFWDGFTLNASAKLIALRLQPVYQSTAIGVKPTTETALPSQGKQIISVGKTQGGIVRRIQVAQEYNTLPEMFNFTFFSEN